jgi:hypothetical protein
MKLARVRIKRPVLNKSDTNSQEKLNNISRSTKRKHEILNLLDTAKSVPRGN